MSLPDFRQRFPFLVAGAQPNLCPDFGRFARFLSRKARAKRGIENPDEGEPRAPQVRAGLSRVKFRELSSGRALTIL